MKSLERKLAKIAELPELYPDRHWVMHAKHAVLSEIGDRRGERRESALDERARLFLLRTLRRFAPSPMRIGAVVIVILLTVSTSFMAQAAVPGDILWPMKITFEKAEVAFAQGAVQEGSVHIRHVDNRLKELGTVISRARSEGSSRNVSQLMRRLEKDIVAASQSLKTSREENTAPEVVIVQLAKDLSVKATEAVQIIEDNKEALSAISDTASVAMNSSGAGTTTQPVTAGDDGSAGNATNTPLTVNGVTVPGATATVAQVIEQVRAVNENITYEALSAMISLVEHGTASNRAEVKTLLSHKLDRLGDGLADVKPLVHRINGNYLLHRAQIATLLKKGTASLELARTLNALDNLSGSFTKALEVKDMVGQMNRLLDEVRSGNGLEPEVIEAPKPAIKQQPAPLTAQSVDVQTETESLDTVIVP